jgi:hypothetical protein
MYVRDEIKKKTGKQVSCYGEFLEDKHDKSIVTFNERKEIIKPKSVYDDLLLNIK